MNEEELKKGCGKEAGFITFTDDFGNKDEDVMLCGDTTKKINGEIELFLCDTCQARLEGFQKGKLEERERVFELLKLKVICRIRGLSVDIDNGYGEFYRGAKIEMGELLRHLENIKYIIADINCALKYLTKEERIKFEQLQKEIGGIE